MVGKGVVRKDLTTPFARKDLLSQVGSRAEPLVADAKGDHCGMEQHFAVWSLVVSAVVWNLT